jgi:hypothetical protein
MHISTCGKIVVCGLGIAGICQFPGGWQTGRDSWVHYGIAFNRDFVGEMKGQAWQDAVVPVTVLYAGEIAEAGLVVLHFRREEKFRGDLEGACRDVLIGVRRVDNVRFGGREGEIVAGVEMLCLHLYASYRRMRVSLVIVIIMACT